MNLITETALCNYNENHTSVCTTLPYMCMYYFTVHVYTLLYRPCVCATLPSMCMRYFTVHVYALLYRTCVCTTLPYMCMHHFTIHVYALLYHTCVCTTLPYMCMYYFHERFQYNAVSSDVYTSISFAYNVLQYYSRRVIHFYLR